MPRGAVGGTFGVVGNTVTPVEFDSFRTPEDVGPLADGAGSEFVQSWGSVGGFRQGFGVRPTVDVLLHGVRWWKPGVAGWESPPWTQVVTSSLWVAEPWGTAPAFASTGNVGETGELWTVPHWETIMFASPVPLAANVEVNVSMSITTNGGTINVSRQAAMFTDGEPSIGGLLEAVQPTSHYDTNSAIEETPWSNADAWYWLDPLVTAA